MLVYTQQTRRGANTVTVQSHVNDLVLYFRFIALFLICSYEGLLAVLTAIALRTVGRSTKLNHIIALAMGTANLHNTIMPHQAKLKLNKFQARPVILTVNFLVINPALI